MIHRLSLLIRTWRGGTGSLCLVCGQLLQKGHDKSPECTKELQRGSGYGQDRCVCYGFIAFTGNSRPSQWRSVWRLNEWILYQICNCYKAFNEDYISMSRAKYGATLQMSVLARKVVEYVANKGHAGEQCAVISALILGNLIFVNNVFYRPVKELFMTHCTSGISCK